MSNPYPQKNGFGLRLQYATKALLLRGTLPDYHRGMYEHDLTARRAFDNCFENDDGDAIVFALVEKANLLPQLKAGIESMGKNVWSGWVKTHSIGQLQNAKQLQLI